MKRVVAGIIVLQVLNVTVCAQTISYRQPETIGIHFLFHDFATAEAIRSSSLATVLDNGSFGRVEDMSEGFALSYGKGLNNHFDFVSMIAGSFLNYPVPGRDNESDQALLFEGDVSIRGKMLSDKYWVAPFLQVGAGISKYKGYWGTYIPAGAGLQVNFFDEAYLLINAQYRIAVTESTSYHFFYSIGLVGNIGKRQE